jgi:hypothetical protein
VSYTIHDAIIVNGHRLADVERAHAKAAAIGLRVTSVVESPINGWASFLICPDGSKGGWAESDLGDRQRAEWIAWARAQWDEIAETFGTKGGAFLTFVHVRFGDINVEDGGWQEGDPEAEIAEMQPDGSSAR